MIGNDPWEDCPLPFADEDVLTAMQAIPGYIDITLEDFKELYRIAYDRAVKRIRESTKAADVMTAPVITVTSGMSLAQAAELLAVKGISGAPVVAEEGGIIGVISETDFLLQMGARPNRSFMAVIAQCLNNQGCIALPVRKQIVADIMSKPAITAFESTTIMDIAATFSQRNINRIPILGASGEITGIVTRRDIVHAVCKIS